MAYTMEDLLHVLHPYCSVKVEWKLDPNRVPVEHGLTTVGLKIHCLGDGQEILGPQSRLWAAGLRSSVIDSIRTRRRPLQ